MLILELFFIIIKTAILSTIYATILYCIIFLIAKFGKVKLFNDLLNKTEHFWFLLFGIVSMLLLIFTFSYEQDTGIGEESKIPIGYGQTIYNVDSEWSYFFPYPDKTNANRDEFKILKFIISDSFLCAEVSHEESDSPTYDYIVYNLKTKTMLTFSHKHDYESYANNYNLPSINKFSSFKIHFYAFLEKRSKWRVWLIP